MATQLKIRKGTGELEEQVFVDGMGKYMSTDYAGTVVIEDISRMAGEDSIVDLGLREIASFRCDVLVIGQESPGEFPMVGAYGDPPESFVKVSIVAIIGNRDDGETVIWGRI